MTNDLETGGQVLVDLRAIVENDRGARYFIDNHPFLKETVELVESKGPR